MIRSFADPRIERFFRDGICPARWQAFENIAKRSLDMLDAAAKLSDLRSPSGNRLESWAVIARSSTTINFVSASGGPIKVRRTLRWWTIV